jgi:hypothetical protein
MMMSFQLGTLEAQDYTSKDWDALLDAALSEHWPALLDHDDLPAPVEFSKTWSGLSKEIGLPQSLVELRRVPDKQLEQYRNELQWLTELYASPEERSTAVMSRSDFLMFFRVRHMTEGGRQGLRLWMKALGQSKPPLSALHRWILGAIQHAGHPSSAQRPI